MKLNLGCGTDVREGYVNVDLHGTDPRVVCVDLSHLPWERWEDESVDEILMLDFLEHFPYSDTQNILEEVHRILKTDGFVDIQVPDFRECSRAVNREFGMYCNKCGALFGESWIACNKCGQKLRDISDDAVRRLYGGQDYPGNWHFTTFTKQILEEKLHALGFTVEWLDVEHQRLNWNMKARATKRSLWGFDP